MISVKGKTETDANINAPDVQPTHDKKKCNYKELAPSLWEMKV